MSVTKKFFELQDLILAKMSLEKVRLHVMERKEKTVFSWVRRELDGFFRKFQRSNEFKQLIDEIVTSIEKSDNRLLLESVEKALSKVYSEIERYYNDLQEA